MPAPHRSRLTSRRPYHQRSGVDVRLLLILALVSLLLALGLYALGQVAVLEPQLGERQRRQEAAAEQP